ERRECWLGENDEWCRHTIPFPDDEEKNRELGGCTDTASRYEADYHGRCRISRDANRANKCSAYRQEQIERQRHCGSCYTRRFKKGNVRQLPQAWPRSRDNATTWRCGDPGKNTTGWL